MTAPITRSIPPSMPSAPAAIQAFRQASAKAKPVLLEPIMRVEVVTPEDYMGGVTEI